MSCSPPQRRIMSLFQNQNGIWRKSSLTQEFVSGVAFENQNRFGSAASDAGRCIPKRPRIIELVRPEVVASDFKILTPFSLPNRSVTAMTREGAQVNPSHALTGSPTQLTAHI